MNSNPVRIILSFVVAVFASSLISDKKDTKEQKTTNKF